MTTSTENFQFFKIYIKLSIIYCKAKFYISVSSYPQTKLYISVSSIRNSQIKIVIYYHFSSYNIFKTLYLHIYIYPLMHYFSPQKKKGGKRKKNKRNKKKVINK